MCSGLYPSVRGACGARWPLSLAALSVFSSFLSCWEHLMLDHSSPEFHCIFFFFLFCISGFMCFIWKIVTEGGRVRRRELRRSLICWLTPSSGQKGQAGPGIRNCIQLSHVSECRGLRPWAIFCCSRHTTRRLDQRWSSRSQTSVEMLLFDIGIKGGGLTHCPRSTVCCWISLSSLVFHLWSLPFLRA